MLESIDRFLTWFSGFIWNWPMLVLLLGGGIFFLAYSRFTPYRHFRHAFHIIRGFYDNPEEAGDIPHFHALVSALSGTIGLGNIAGVAIAISIGGPGAVFWMWITALLGVATKYFTCTLAIMYRGRDSLGQIQGGPMYVITEGLGRGWRWLAVWFSLAGLIGTLPIFQINQLTQIMRQEVATPLGLAAQDRFWFDLFFGIGMAVLVALVIFGGIKRIGRVASRLVPVMVVAYLLMAIYIMLIHYDQVPAAFALIFTDAFTGEAAGGGALGAVIIYGIRRGVFSNEAGVGTESMAHGAAKTSEPIREGLVAMTGPVIDTMIVCTCTAIVIIVTGVWQEADVNGIRLTAMAFDQMMPGRGAYVLALAVAVFSLSTMFTYWYYGAKCLGFLVGAEYGHLYRYIYTVMIVAGSVVSLDIVVNLIDSGFALMAVPTVVSTILLAPKVMEASRDYFRRHPDV